MKRHAHITAFYLETLLLIFVFIAVILVLTRVFGLGQTLSGDAELLTNAVCLAQNAAEAMSASDSGAELAALLDQGGNVVGGEDRVLARYDRDMTPNAGGELVVEITRTPRDGLVYGTVNVYHGDDAAPVYRLDTAVYREGAAG